MSDIPKISIGEAKMDKLFYVVANVVILNSSDRTCLLIRRSKEEKVLGGKWVFPGGKLEHVDILNLLKETGNSPIDGVNDILGQLATREAKEECGLTVDGVGGKIIRNKVFIRPDKIPVFMATITAKYNGGPVVLEDKAFSEYAWVNEQQLSNYDCPEGVQSEAKEALSL